MLATEFGTGQVFWSMLWFFMFFIWVWLLITIFADIFRSRDLSGWGKAAWSILVIVLPFIGVFGYLIARGGKMAQHEADEARRQDEQFRAYINDAVATGPVADDDQLSKLASLRAQGVINDDEYRRMRSRVTAA
jgi:hypothetical protein